MDFFCQNSDKKSQKENLEKKNTGPLSVKVANN